MDPIRQWREAHPTLPCEDIALKQVAPFPSLAVNDYIHFLEAKGVDAETREFIKAMAREMVFAYDCWKLAVSQATANEVLDSLMASSSPMVPEYNKLCDLIASYKRTHNIGTTTGEGLINGLPAWAQRGVEVVA